MQVKLDSIFSGIQPFSMIDFPGKISAILFTGGCNFRCSYCHNPEFVLSEKIKYTDVNEILSFLEKRQGKLNGIVICGGEPTIHESLIDWIKLIKSFGYKVKLDTNGTSPETVEKLIDEGLIDFFAVDYKAQIKNYEKIINRKVNTKKIIDSIKKIVDSGIDYEIRTTIHPRLHSNEEIEQIVIELKELGVKNYNLQLFKMPKETVGKISEEKYSMEEVEKLKESLKEKFESFELRNE